MMTTTRVSEVVTTTDQSCVVNHDRRHWGQPTATDPRTCTPCRWSEAAAVTAAPTTTAARAQGRRGFTRSPTTMTARVTTANSTDHPLSRAQ